MLQLRLELARKAFMITADLEIQTGSVFALFGPSAAGKSSILSFMAGFETTARDAYLAIDGDVYVDTSRQFATLTPPWSRRIAYMTQSPRLFPHLTVRDNILYGTRHGKEKHGFEQLISALELSDYLTYRPQRLSGGLMQRVALARALASKPRILLMDEPFSALDAMARAKLQNLILDIHHAFPITIVLVSHQFTEVQKLADEMALIDNGHIVQTGTPAVLMDHPASWQVARLLGYSTVVENGYISYAVHPDRVIVGSCPESGCSINGTVEDIVFYEGRQRVRVHIDAPWRVKDASAFEVNLAITEDVRVSEPITLTLVHPPQIG
jgi:ABC-type Fe3+/spermidine/putrescine transport system ATPase subunit